MNTITIYIDTQTVGHRDLGMKKNYSLTTAFGTTIITPYFFEKLKLKPIEPSDEVTIWASHENLLEERLYPFFYFLENKKIISFLKEFLDHNEDFRRQIEGLKALLEISTYDVIVFAE